MENKKTETLTKIIVGVVIALIVGGSSPWWWNKYIDPPNKPPVVTKKQDIYKKGNKTIKIEGVSIKPPAINTSDSYIFKKIDLDSGTVDNSLDSDVELTINVHKLLVSIRLKEGVLIGNSATSYLKCKTLLNNNNGKKLVIQEKIVPTPYYCTVTDNGRISQFNIASINRYKTPQKNIYTIIINIKFTTWKI